MDQLGILFSLFLLTFMANAQDGSSELLIEKPTISTSNSRLRVRCTDDNLRLYHNATTCSDEREPESCKMIFTIAPSNSPAARDPKCGKKCIFFIDFVLLRQPIAERLS